MKKIKIPIYFGELILCKKKNWKKIEKKYNLEGTKGFLAYTFQADMKSGVSRYFICLPEKFDAGVVAHEVIHFVNLLFDDRGIKLDSKNDEPLAYMVGWGVSQVSKFLKK